MNQIICVFIIYEGYCIVMGQDTKYIFKDNGSKLNVSNVNY